MTEQDRTIFVTLFRETCQKAFGFPLGSVLTEADCKLLSNKIFESTGLVIGAKSLKNYSSFIVTSSRTENPSVATLDTLARYVLDAPHTDEVLRKDTESHYPYWFQYRSRFSATLPGNNLIRANRKTAAVSLIVILGLILVYYAIKAFIQTPPGGSFVDNFNTVSADSLKKRGWIIRSVDTTWLKKANERPGHLALFTIRGDNWPDNNNSAVIKNLVMRRIIYDCFTVETHITNFFPHENWQQAGLLLSEDSTLSGNMIRLSISYNDFFGGYKRPPEIIIQAVSSLPGDPQSKPEEIAHYSLKNIEPGQEDLVRSNLAITALKIEKKNNHFRFLYSAGPVESFAFREVVSGDFNINPRYVGIFAIQGWANNAGIIPAYFDSFMSAGISCGK